MESERNVLGNHLGACSLSPITVLAATDTVNPKTMILACMHELNRQELLSECGSIKAVFVFKTAVDILGRLQ